MKQKRELKGEGKRLAELLDMQFDSQREAAEFLGLSQPQLWQYMGKESLPRMFWGKYAPKLADAGLNAMYISDPENNAPMFEEAAEAYLTKIAQKLKLQKTA